jgi:hypothetical protein
MREGKNKIKSIPEFKCLKSMREIRIIEGKKVERFEFLDHTNGPLITISFSARKYRHQHRNNNSNKKLIHSILVTKTHLTTIALHWQLRVGFFIIHPFCCAGN